MLSLLYVLIAGIALPVGGVQMQYLWRNQLGDIYSLGLGSAACLGAAAATMSGWCSLTVGSFICTLICTAVCFFVTMKVSTQNLITFGILFGLYAIGAAFYMPTIALSNSVAFKILETNGYDTVKDFPPIRVFGTVGFILAMLFVNFVSIDGVQFQNSYNQFLTSGILGIAMLLYCFTLPNCPCNKETGSNQTLAERFGLNAFRLFKDKQMAIFFVFSMLLGVALQITNGFANPFISHFQEIPAFADTWGARNANALISISQISETLGILLIPIVMRIFGIKKVMLIAMFAWVLRFGFFGAGDPGAGVWMLILSMIVYGVAFDFFNISGALYTNMRTSEKMQNSAQGLFMLMTNGIGATIGTLSAQAVVNHFVNNAAEPDWSAAWYVFAGYSLVVALLFMVLFKEPKDANDKIA